MIKLTDKKRKKKNRIPIGGATFLVDVESKTESEYRDNVLQTQINQIKSEIKEMKKNAKYKP